MLLNFFLDNNYDCLNCLIRGEYSIKEKLQKHFGTKFGFILTNPLLDYLGKIICPLGWRSRRPSAWLQTAGHRVQWHEAWLDSQGRWDLRAVIINFFIFLLLFLCIIMLIAIFHHHHLKGLGCLIIKLVLKVAFWHVLNHDISRWSEICIFRTKMGPRTDKEKPYTELKKTFHRVWGGKACAQCAEPICGALFDQAGPLFARLWGLSLHI